MFTICFLMFAAVNAAEPYDVDCREDWSAERTLGAIGRCVGPLPESSTCRVEKDGSIFFISLRPAPKTPAKTPAKKTVSL